MFEDLTFEQWSNVVAVNLTVANVDGTANYPSAAGQLLPPSAMQIG